MKKKIFIAVALIMTLFVVYNALQYYRAIAKDSIANAWPQLILAEYDTATNKIIKTNDSILHYTISWQNNAMESLPTKDIKALIHNNQAVFINLQILSRKVISKLDENILTIINSGYYDDKLITFFKLLSTGKNTIYLRYNPDMEVPLYKYPWQAQSYHEYVQSFQHIFSMCKKYAPAIKIVWGPAGYPGAEEYWPGEDYVDLISVNINKKPETPDDRYKPYPTITEEVRRKFFRMRFMNKPILFLGSAAVNRISLQQDWLDELNVKIATDKHIYRTKVEPANHDYTINTSINKEKIQLGVYDPLLLLTKQPLVTTEHIFTDMISVMNGIFKKDFDAVMSRNHHAIVTIEPWKDGKIEKDPLILANTLNGKYDKVWRKLYEEISNTPHLVFLRWGHEMEIPVDRYAWQNQDPVAYIKAFRYFATFQQPRASNIRIVWGPAGDRGSIEWWPGEDVVDYVSLAIYGLPDKNINDYNKQRSFNSIFQNKFYRMRFTHKPIFITEFGVKGPESYQKKWLEEAAVIINRYPEIKGISYFNFADTPKAWGDAETPDWSITDTTFISFAGLLKEQPKK